MRAIGIILAGGNSYRMKELSSKRAVCAMPIAGSYRSIDFALSNMTNSDIQRVAVLTQYNAWSLNEHLSSSKWWDFGRKQGGLYVFTPSITSDNGFWYRGTADAIAQNIGFLKKSHEPYVVIASSNAVYKLDYNKVLEYHIEKNGTLKYLRPDGKTQFRLLGRMLPAYFTALGTQSSAATIPVTLRQSIKNGVSEDIAGFVIPLCATIHLSGSTLKIVACALALMMMQGMPFDFPMFAGFIFMLGITMVAAPGVPGGAIMAALSILSSMLGFGESEQALMIALYIAMDSFGTACNVTGDGAIALIIDKFFGKK
mgnify:CR=1 FL=1